MKIAVYAIALNEEQHAERWADSALEADYRIVCDTGSTDSTLEILEDAANDIRLHQITVRPWRFDTARNAALALVPPDADVCIALDMDEELRPGWRDALEKAWTPETTRLRHPFAFRQNADGTPSEIMYGTRIHGRFDYIWRWPIHEALMPVAGSSKPEHISWCDDLWVYHHHSAKPTRAQYLPMLATAALAEPQDERMAFYHARELMYTGRYAEAASEFKRYLDLPTAKWADQRAEAMRYIGRCYEQLGEDGATEAPAWFHRACLEAPLSRLSWYEWARNRMKRGDWAGGYWAAQNMLTCPMPKGELYDDKEMRAGAYDVGGCCAWYLGLKQIADQWLRAAAEMYPTDERMQKNLTILTPTMMCA